MRDRPREQEVQRRAAALLEHDLEQLVERVAADEERQRLVLVRRPGEQLVEEERGRRQRDRRHAEREPARRQPTAARPPTRAPKRCACAVSLIVAVSLPGYTSSPCRSTSTGARTGTFSRSSSGCPTLRRSSARCAARAPSRRCSTRSPCISRAPGSTRPTTAAARGRRRTRRRTAPATRRSRREKKPARADTRGQAAAQNSGARAFSPSSSTIEPATASRNGFSPGEADVGVEDASPMKPPAARR